MYKCLQKRFCTKDQIISKDIFLVFNSKKKEKKIRFPPEALKSGQIKKKKTQSTMLNSP